MGETCCSAVSPVKLPGANYATFFHADMISQVGADLRQCHVSVMHL